MYDLKEQVDLSFKKRSYLTDIGLACLPLRVDEVRFIKVSL